MSIGNIVMIELLHQVLYD